MVSEVFSKQNELEEQLRRERIISDDLYLLNVLMYANVNVAEIFRKSDIKRIAVYGIGRVGKAFVRFLLSNGIDVVCGIDQNPDVEFSGLILRKNISEIPNDIDTVIITPTYYAEEILTSFAQKEGIKLLLMRDVIDNLLLIPRR